MRLTEIPGTDLQVSRIAYGAMQLGGDWDRAPLTDSARRRAEVILEAVIENGINHIDLADIYTLGKSDEALGHVLRKQPSLRSRLVLETKGGIVLGSDQQPQHYDFSYNQLVSSVDGTLRRLGTDHVDILALHRPDALAQPQEVARAFDHLHAAGKVRYFGVSNHSAGQIELLRRAVDQPIVCNQLQLSLAHHALISDGLLVNTDQQGDCNGLLDYCRRHQIMVQAWSPLAGGALTHDGPLAEQISALADQYAVSAEAIALAWIMRHPAGIQPVVGTTRVDRLQRCTQAASLQLDRAHWYALLQAARGAPVP